MTSVSGAFVVIVPDCEFGDNGTFIFADCAVNPNPSAEQLAEFAFQSSQTAKSVAGIENPIIGMMSFSTKGSASHEFVDKVVKATEIAKQRWPELAVDGEFKLMPHWFPRLVNLRLPAVPRPAKPMYLFSGSGCRQYRVQTGTALAKAEAIGPILQGMNKPVNDLSRGCSVEDVVNVVAITAVKAQ